MKYDVVSIGELLIDFTPTGGPWEYKANPGGAPANLLAQLARLGHDTCFMGMVGQDAFGEYLRDTLVGFGVGTGGLLFHPEVPTTLAFVHISESGDRSFTFVRNPGADILYSKEDIDTGIIDACRIFHFGGVSLTREPMRGATLQAVRYARQAGRLVTFDPNYRPPLWGSAQEAARIMAEAVPLCDVLKISDDEAVMLSGETNLPKAAEALAARGPALVLVTQGPRGCLCHHKNLRESFYTYDTKVRDTTGSGDSFFGALLSRLLKTGKAVEDLDANTLREMVHFGNASGATCAAGYGAMPSLPDEAAIRACIASIPLLQL